MHFLRSLTLMPVLAVCLLATFVPIPALGQVPPPGEEDLLSRAGDFPAIDAGGQGGFVSVWTESLEVAVALWQNREVDPEDAGLFLYRFRAP